MCKLNKSLYGLKQSSKQWNMRFDKFMAHIGFTKIQFYLCVNFRFLHESFFIIILLYVDNILIENNLVVEVMRVKDELN